MSDIHHFATEYPRPVPTRDPRGLVIYNRFGKRVLDICFAIILLPVLAPLIVLLMGLAKLDGGPGLFRHQRVGRNGKPFRCLKVRTMATNAETKLASHLSTNPDAAREWKLTFKLANDPRITKVGRFLRRTGLDELPQIWNVLRGEISFVGPRPVTEPEMAMYGRHKSAYLSVRPGVTGMWQIYGRMSGCYDNRVQLDRGYLEVISLKSDIALIGQTALSVVRMTGS
jgi:exopolysaccharide production protein ExoY